MRTVLSRLLLVALLGVAVFAVIRLASGASGSIVDLGDLSPDDLDHDAFVLGAAATVAIDAAGSYEEAGTPASDTTLAATGWIVRRDDGALVWRLGAPRPGRGTLVSVADTVRLGAGTYDVYFAAYGDPLVRPEGPRDGSLIERVRAFLSRGGRSWVGEAARWRMRVFPVDDAARRAEPAKPRDPADAHLGTDSLRLWQAHGVRNRQHREVLISVSAPSRVTVRAVTEIVGGVVADVPSIVQLGRRDTVWTASGPGEWAGGSLKNRVVQERVALAPGIYRVAYDADRSHGYGGWAANPPWRPWEWGLTLTRDPGGAVTLLDPDALDLPVLVAFECVGSDEDRQAEFTLTDPTDLLVVAVGEIDAGSRYDYATVDRLDGDDWDEIWDLADADRMPAGGARKNQRAVEALALEPGTYRLRYRTDGSHDCQDGYNGGGGPDGDLWGAVLYALDRDLAPGIVQVRAERDEEFNLDAYAAQRLLAAIDSVGNDATVETPFTLDRPTSVTVVAAGEVSRTSRYDYAEILANGRPVWEMTYERSRPGGASGTYHRIAENQIVLEAGTYVLRYRSDDSRSFGDFGPSSKVLWGVRVYGPARPAEAPSDEASQPGRELVTL